MLQAFKRSRFLMQNNYTHWNAGNVARMYAWLMQHSWPADKFVDLFMRCHLNFDPLMDGDLKFKPYMFSQFDYVHDEDNKALKWLYEHVDTPQFRGVDKDGLIDWLYIIYQGIVEGEMEGLRKSNGADAISEEDRYIKLWQDDTPMTKAKFIRRLVWMLELKIDTNGSERLKQMKIALRDGFDIYFNTEIKYKSAVWAIYELSASKNIDAILGYKEMQRTSNVDISSINFVIEDLSLEIGQFFEGGCPEYAQLETGDLYL